MSRSLIPDENYWKDVPENSWGKEIVVAYKHEIT